jgi:hypothetical protein
MGHNLTILDFHIREANETPLGNVDERVSDQVFVLVLNDVVQSVGLVIEVTEVVNVDVWLIVVPINIKLLKPFPRFFF